MKASRVIVTFGIGAVYAVVSLLPVSAQDSSQPGFEVVSIKPNKSGDRSVAGFQSGGRFIATNTSVRELIRIAYGTAEALEDARVIGGPSWTQSERFDVLAKASDNAPPQLMILMLRSLLAERFKLAIQTESRELPIYTLVMATGDGKLGPRLRPVVDCTPSGGGLETPALPKAAQCGGFGREGHLEFGGLPLSMVVRTPALLREVGRIIVDRTGLTGAFEGSLDWTPSESRLSGANLLDPVSPLPQPPDGPSLFTALQEQLGLKLVSTTGPVEVFVIDKIERPTEN